MNQPLNHPTPRYDYGADSTALAATHLREIQRLESQKQIIINNAKLYVDNTNATLGQVDALIERHKQALAILNAQAHGMPAPQAAPFNAEQPATRQHPQAQGFPAGTAAAAATPRPVAQAPQPEPKTEVVHNPPPVPPANGHG